MSEIGEKIAAIIDSSFAPLLKEQGFRRRAANYHRFDGDAIQVVTVQSSHWNSGDSGKFRVNFGVHFPEVATLLHGSDPMPKVPSERYCVLRAIGSFPDRWWSINPASDAAEVGLALETLWSEIVWPWLEANKHLPAAAKTLERTAPMAASAAYLVMGERMEAVRVVRSFIEGFERAIVAQSTDPASVEVPQNRLSSARTWAAKHDLLD